MKRLLFIILLFPSLLTAQVVADHTVVDLYDQIPQRWIDSVKTKWLVVAGESHSEGYRSGLAQLEDSSAVYAVNNTESGTPEAYTTSHLRSSRATWGNIDNATGWVYSYGEEDWWTTSAAEARTKAGITYCNANNLTIFALGFGWCYDPQGGAQSSGTDPVTGNHWYGVSEGLNYYSWGLDDADNALTDNTINMDTYLAATQGYIDYCADSINTTVFFTTAPMDDWNGVYGAEEMFQTHLKNEHIRQYVDTDETLFLFDYADILCFDNDGTGDTATWSGNDYPVITTANDDPDETGHISNVGALRLGKAMWWLLARIAGWDGEAEECTKPYLGDYYVRHTEGSDSYPGTCYDSAFQSIQAAVDVAVAGDTIWIEAGDYITTEAIQILPERVTPIGNSGEYGNRISYLVFPEYDSAVINCATHCDGYTGWTSGFEIEGAEYLYFRDIVVKNLPMCDSNQVSGGFSATESSNITYERCVVHDIGMRGFYYTGGNYAGGPHTVDTTQYINCDAFNICDTLVVNPGNAGDGWKLRPYEGGVVVLNGCRAWNYSDDGVDPSGEGKRVILNSWAMAGSKYAGFGIEGNGFKVAGIVDDSLEYCTAYIQNCLAIYCNNTESAEGIGFTLLAADATYPNFMRAYNNTTFQCDIGFAQIGGDGAVSYGSVWRNNLSVSPAINHAGGGPWYVYLWDTNSEESHNNWDYTGGDYPYFEVSDTFTVTSADFTSGLDSATVVNRFIAPRQSDGSLPAVHPLALAEGSDLIDGGTIIPLTDSIGESPSRFETYVVSYNGSAPDLGASEYNYTAPTYIKPKSINGGLGVSRRGVILKGP